MRATVILWGIAAALMVASGAFLLRGCAGVGWSPALFADYCPSDTGPDNLAELNALQRERDALQGRLRLATISPREVQECPIDEIVVCVVRQAALVAVLVDTSGSMRTDGADGRPRFRSAQDAMVSLIRGAPPEVAFEFYGFDDDVRGPISGRFDVARFGQAEQAAGQIEPRDTGTNLLRAIREIAGRIPEDQPVNVVMITDAEDNISETDFCDAIAAFSQVRPLARFSLVQLIESRLSGACVENTGGRLIYARDPSNLGGQLAIVSGTAAAREIPCPDDS